jgi:hypothetical protein
VRRGEPSFRLKLQLALMAAVAAVTGATLVVVRGSAEATYRTIAADRFASDVRFFAALQDARLAAVRARCRRVARSVRLIAAIQEADPALLYKIAGDELRDVLFPDAEGARPARFFRFVAADGSVVAPPDERSWSGEVPDDARWETDLAAAVRSLDGPNPQHVGYLAPMIAGRPALREVVVTRIVDPVAGRRLGALALGFPVDDRAELRTGIFLDGRLYSSSIPEALHAAVVRAVGDEIGGSSERTVAVDGVPHRVFERALDPPPGFPPAYQVGLYASDASTTPPR